MRIGVLALQGGFIEHIKQIEKLEHIGVLVKNEKDLESIDGLILPGGESTAMGKLLKVTGLINPLRDKVSTGLPTFGTCAGMILLAKEIEGENPYLGVMNIKVKRNAFGRQLGSFREVNAVKYIENDIELVFIRAPYVKEFSGEVEVLARIKDKIVAVKERNILATAFHPELTGNLEVMDYFINMCKENKY